MSNSNRDVFDASTDGFGLVLCASLLFGYKNLFNILYFVYLCYT